MKKLSILLISLLSSAAVFAQAEPAGREIVMNTDQDKVAEIERHAQELKDKQDAAAINAPAPTAAGPMHKGKRHHKRMHRHEVPTRPDMAMPDAPKPDMPMPAPQ